ncbi:hypothetical protein ASPWEDRAFT_654684 [Aspergillus wentii DTO 134E9]|uniref:Cytochrome P450 n=1 Tax=Aspergillus wentii DTO 134E9 TaxID=1073089 RepID=A0A1L9RBE3_ASPWE|nr:uncharacterized protein ASPWEDRAFT_654684 [Aspergillus wentii DTO 134E9]KAI9934766.1 hypothetical protein MW887_000383 [Aspergillus wentii]OJJ32193.1 hypothetical protein ASPWEDRAFT_654684 [Aspergillus wentii DTO 134E9]
MSFFIASLIVALIGLYIVKSFLTPQKHHPPLPPGPRPKPFIGNLQDLPSVGDQDWKHWYKHKDLYGPISSVTAFGQTIVVLNEARLAVELLEKRSAIHSDRPPGVFSELSGWNLILGTLPYSDRFRSYRKILHQQIGSNLSVSRFNHVQETEARRFLLRVLNSPEDVIHHIRKEAGAIILKVGYGYTIEPHGRDPLVDLGDRGMAEFSLALQPGTWLVDFIPFLRYLPTWVPGVAFTKIASKFKKTATAFTDLPYEFVKRKLAQNTFEPSFLSHLLQEQGHLQPGSEEELILKGSAGSLYAGGADTTVSSMTSFFMVMALNPHAQRRAQEEIDRVVGTNRLPGYQDRDHLPYINAMVKEVLRWHPVVPSGVAHQSIEEDICEGYYIPKGAIVISNIWAFTHDPDIYPDPMAFKPERFLNTENHIPERDPHLLSFGFGRRVCPGRTLADSNIYLSIAMSLAVFDIAPAIKDGKEVGPTVEFRPGAISHPVPFDMDIKPRSQVHEELIRSVEKEFPWEKSHAAELGAFEF